MRQNSFSASELIETSITDFPESPRASCVERVHFNSSVFKENMHINNDSEAKQVSCDGN
jgi:hypothetical protein